MPTKIEVLRDDTAGTPSDKGFLKVRRLTLRAHFERDDGGAVSTEPFKYDAVEREALDAVMMLLHAKRDGHPRDPFVCVRTALRPPVAMRGERALVVPDARTDGVLWELPAGLIEKGAEGEEAILETAARETLEETGYALEPRAFVRLGTAVYLSPGLCAEKLHVVRAEVDRSKGGKPTATETVELASRLEWWPLSRALEQAERGVIEDCKTELALRRLQALLTSER